MMSATAQSFHRRAPSSDQDFWRVRNLLIETYPITPLGFNWDVRRWDGRRFYDQHLDATARLDRCVQLWETVDGRLVAVVHPEGDGEAHVQAYPDFRRLEAEIFAWAEAHLAVATADGARRQLDTFVYEYDTARQQLLTNLGYVKQPFGGVARRLHLADYALTPPEVAPGYHLRTTQPNDLADCQRIADLLNAAFNRDFHNAQEYQNFTRFAPSFRPELDLVAVAPDGSFAAYVGAPYDEANRRGIFEPVCAHPQHRRRGLARALMLEGLRRLDALGATTVTVETGDMIPANQLYDSLGFTEVCKGYIWRKVF
jgi:mycothiol synthase